MFVKCREPFPLKVTCGPVGRGLLPPRPLAGLGFEVCGLGLVGAHLLLLCLSFQAKDVQALSPQ